MMPVPALALGLALVVFEPISDQLGSATEVVVACLDELCRFLRVVGKHCEGHALLRQTAVIHGTQAPCGDALGRVLGIGASTVVLICRIVMHDRANPTDRRGFA
jgi:hypothetical protein